MSVHVLRALTEPFSGTKWSKVQRERSSGKTWALITLALCLADTGGILVWGLGGCDSDAEAQLLVILAPLGPGPPEARGNGPTAQGRGGPAGLLLRE